ncbi:hypothetical protein B0J13DRAFT_66972 [Dactylonectria estremocensis]|uniref:Uncharacterized protein n=1 Tax=Dactylonectria estremocensis TaxID=1079267 RepID=A0A9P9EKV5_9HYPO|nr:hypothetical protein B0J13DRAFT_66972 [Dactylonectria estremocensis]
MHFSFEPWFYAQTGLIVAAVLALFGAWIASISRVHGRAEPGRAAFIFLEVIMILYMVHLVMAITANMIIVKRANLIHGHEGSEDEYWAAFKKSMDRGLIVNIVRVVSSIIANALLLFSLVELGSGLMFMLKQQRSKSQKTMRYLALSFAAIMFILQLAILPLMHKYWPMTWKNLGNETMYSHDSSTAGDMMRGLTAIQHLNLTYEVLNLVTAIAVLVYASIVMHAYRTVKSTRGCAISFLAMAILFFIRAMWLLVNHVSVVYMYTGVKTESDLMLDIFLNHWPYTAILLTLFFLALKKQGGIWTTEQPWMRTSEKSLPSVEENRSQ